MKLLIIDNEPGQRAALRSLLHAFGPEITEIEEADGVLSGLLKIKSFRPDIIMLDVEM